MGKTELSPSLLSHLVPDPVVCTHRGVSMTADLHVTGILNYSHFASPSRYPVFSLRVSALFLLSLLESFCSLLISPLFKSFIIHHRFRCVCYDIFVRIYMPIFTRQGMPDCIVCPNSVFQTHDTNEEAVNIS